MEQQIKQLLELILKRALKCTAHRVITNNKLDRFNTLICITSTYLRLWFKKDMMFLHVGISINKIEALATLMLYGDYIENNKSYDTLLNNAAIETYFLNLFNITKDEALSNISSTISKYRRKGLSNTIIFYEYGDIGIMNSLIDELKQYYKDVTKTI